MLADHRMADDLELSPKIEIYRRILERQPSSRVFVSLAEEYRLLQMYEEAIVVLEEGLRRHPNYWSARVALARAYQESGAALKAQSELERVVEVAPENLLANRVLAELYERAGLIVQALERYRRVVVLAPEDVVAREHLSRLERSRPQPSVSPLAPPPLSEPAGRAGVADRVEVELGESDLEPMLELPSDGPSDRLEPIQAEPLAPSAALVDPSQESAPVAAEETFTTETLGDLYLQQRCRERAAEIFRRLLQADPGNQALQAKLEAALALPAAGALERLEQWLRRVQQLRATAD
jgi:tetratricopeptide (TPR) repeat protein